MEAIQLLLEVPPEMRRAGFSHSNIIISLQNLLLQTHQGAWDMESSGISLEMQSRAEQGKRIWMERIKWKQTPDQHNPTLLTFNIYSYLPPMFNNVKCETPPSYKCLLLLLSNKRRYKSHQSLYSSWVQDLQVNFCPPHLVWMCFSWPSEFIVKLSTNNILHKI